MGLRPPSKMASLQLWSLALQPAAKCWGETAETPPPETLHIFGGTAEC